MARTITPTESHDWSVYIGRFQPFHLGHLALLQRALALAPRCVVVLGSAHQARTPKNPWTWQERAEMIRLALPAVDRDRVQFLPVRDHYDQGRWVQAVRQGVAEVIAQAGGSGRAHVALVGHFKDATSAYLRDFSEWTVLPVEREGLVDGTHVRDALFGAAPEALEATLAALISQVPRTTVDFMRAWSALPFVPELAKEWCMLRKYHQDWSAAPYPPVFVTVDAVVRCAGCVLLIRRGQAPGKGLYAVPGGFIEQRETVYQSALRELEEETCLTMLPGTWSACLRSVAVFDHPDRSLRGRTITHAHYFDLGDRELPEVKAADDAQSVCWMPIEKLPALEDQFHDDHFHMLDHFLGLTT
ncbi:MAG TPA: bifunctional nicotinamide-nucleotide adenylyltransferase/Nudix hydroxylase [Aquabacterium sp.]|jgi:bifunctional NMN adenylyltransferase/nudix hydrolase|nr:bifunctional nicotinamide-nucleotide adenylyltransferase/Nudix hydroxylase [Aquabacterium sp.]HRH28075.1 bifunctional nicotinamide-nucleotide adenylyltransferase/Nudix hydroxylase [Aquabacterium sp.]